MSDHVRVNRGAKEERNRHLRVAALSVVHRIGAPPRSLQTEVFALLPDCIKNCGPVFEGASQLIRECARHADSREFEINIEPRETHGLGCKKVEVALAFPKNMLDNLKRLWTGDLENKRVSKFDLHIQLKTGIRRSSIWPGSQLPE